MIYPKLTLKISDHHIKLMGDRSPKGILWNVDRVKKVDDSVWRKPSYEDDVILSKAISWAEQNPDKLRNVIL